MKWPAEPQVDDYSLGKNYDRSEFKDQMHFKGKNTWGEEWTVDLNRNFPHRASQKRTRGRTGTGKEWNDGWLYNGPLSEKHSGAAILSDIQNLGSCVP